MSEEKEPTLEELLEQLKDEDVTVKRFSEEALEKLQDSAAFLPFKTLLSLLKLYPLANINKLAELSNMEKNNLEMKLDELKEVGILKHFITDFMPEKIGLSRKIVFFTISTLHQFTLLQNALSEHNYIRTYNRFYGKEFGITATFDLPENTERYLNEFLEYCKNREFCEEYSIYNVVGCRINKSHNMRFIDSSEYQKFDIISFWEKYYETEVATISTKSITELSHYKPLHFLLLSDFTNISSLRKITPHDELISVLRQYKDYFLNLEKKESNLSIKEKYLYENLSDLFGEQEKKKLLELGFQKTKTYQKFEDEYYNPVKDNLLENPRWSFHPELYRHTSTANNITRLYLVKPNDEKAKAKFYSLFKKNAFPFPYYLEILQEAILFRVTLPPYYDSKFSYLIWSTFKDFKIYSLDFFGRHGMWWPFYIDNYDWEAKAWRTDEEWMYTSVIEKIENRLKISNFDKIHEIDEKLIVKRKEEQELTFEELRELLEEAKYEGEEEAYNEVAQELQKYENTESKGLLLDVLNDNNKDVFEFFKLVVQYRLREAEEFLEASVISEEANHIVQGIIRQLRGGKLYSLIHYSGESNKQILEFLLECLIQFEKSGKNIPEELLKQVKETIEEVEIMLLLMIIVEEQEDSINENSIVIKELGILKRIMRSKIISKKSILIQKYLELFSYTINYPLNFLQKEKYFPLIIEFLEWCYDWEAFRPLLFMLENEAKSISEDIDEQQKHETTFLEILYSQLKEDNQERKNLAVNVFSELWSEGTITSFLKLEISSGDLSKSETKKIFRKLGEKTVPLLVVELNNEDWKIRKAIVELIGEVEGIQALDNLVKALEEEKEQEVRTCMQYVIEKLTRLRKEKEEDPLSEIEIKEIIELIKALTSGLLTPKDFKSEIKKTSRTVAKNLFRDSFPKFTSELRSKCTDTFLRYFWDDEFYQINELWQLVEHRNFWPQLRFFHDNIDTRKMNMSEVIENINKNLELMGIYGFNLLEQEVLELLEQEPNLLIKDIARKLSKSEKTISNVMNGLKNKGISIGTSVDYSALDHHEIFLLEEPHAFSNKLRVFENFILEPKISLSYGISSEVISDPSILTVVDKKMFSNTSVFLYGITLESGKEIVVKDRKKPHQSNRDDVSTFYVTPVSKDYVIELVRASESDYKRPKIKKIADLFDVSVRTLFRIKSKLIDSGIIQPQLIIDREELLEILVFSEEELSDYYSKVPSVKVYKVEDYEGNYKWMTFLSIFTEDYEFLSSEIQEPHEIYLIVDKNSLGDGLNKSGSDGDDNFPTPSMRGDPPDSPASMSRKLKSKKREEEEL